MLRKLTLAIGTTLLLSGTAIAAPAFPSSVSEAGPNYPAPSAAAPARAVGGAIAGELQVPSSVSESMPEMTGDVAHPTHTGATGGTTAPRFLQGGTWRAPAVVLRQAVDD